jgi:hypothetical protein
MATIITKYSDYAVHSIEFFIEKITTELTYRDIPGLTNDKVEIINVTKQHPLVALMAAQLQNDSSVHRSGLLPSISVTPGTSPGDGFTIGQGLETGIVDDDFIANLDVLDALTDKERLDSGLLTKAQISTIKTAYSAVDPGFMLYELNQWRRKEEIHVSAWSRSADMTNLMSNLLDSILAEVQVGFAGDNSPIVNFSNTKVEGLTNFNFGRVLFGSEYTLTFLNTFGNYTIYTETRVSEHENDFTYTTPGE